MNDFDSWTYFVAMYGSLYFGVMFLIAVAYALRPKNRSTFEHAANSPLTEED